MGTKGAGSVLKGRWCRSGKWDRCRHCGRSDRPHEAKGYCSGCASYHANIERARAARKKARMAKPDEWHAKKYAKEQRWKKRNRKRDAKLKADWHRRNYSPKFVVGDRVAFEWCGHTCMATVVEKPFPRVIVVRLDGGTIERIGCKRWPRVRKIDVPEKVVPKHAGAPDWHGMLRPEIQDRLAGRVVGG